MSRVLAGAAVVVTGAGRGLGAAYAEAAAAHGAAVLVNDVHLERARDTTRRIRTAGGSACADGSDVSDWDRAGRLVGRCVAEFGAIDGLVNNAGIVHAGPPATDDGETLARVVGVNLLGTLYCGTHALRHMLERGRGAIVNVTSGAALGMADMAGYAASKGGITALTYGWAASVVDTAVRVNAVSPDADTPAAAELRTRFPELPAGSFSPESNAAAVVHLLSPACELNGRVLTTGGPELRLLGRPRASAPVSHDDWSPEEVGRAVRELTGGSEGRA